MSRRTQAWLRRHILRSDGPGNRAQSESPPDREVHPVSPPQSKRTILTDGACNASNKPRISSGDPPTYESLFSYAHDVRPPCGAVPSRQAPCQLADIARFVAAIAAIAPPEKIMACADTVAAVAHGRAAMLFAVNLKPGTEPPGWDGHKKGMTLIGATSEMSHHLRYRGSKEVDDCFLAVFRSIDLYRDSPDDAAALADQIAGLARSVAHVVISSTAASDVHSRATRKETAGTSNLDTHVVAKIAADTATAIAAASGHVESRGTESPFPHPFIYYLYSPEGSINLALARYTPEQNAALDTATSAKESE